MDLSLTAELVTKEPLLTLSFFISPLRGLSSLVFIIWLIDRKSGLTGLKSGVVWGAKYSNHRTESPVLTFGKNRGSWIG